jgi:signal transduction histidine kinase
VRASGRVAAYAPIPDSWGANPALVWVDGPAAAPLWRRILFPAACTLLAGLLVALVVWSTDRVAERLEQHLAKLVACTRALAAGQMPGPIGLGHGAQRELADLAEALEALRTRVEAQATGQPLPPAPASAEEEQQRALLGDASEFDLALVLQQLVEPARKVAHARRIDLQLVLPDGLPAQLIGHPVALFRALDALLRNALRATTEGRIILRASRVSEGPEGGKLRFEVSDTSPGVPFKDQPELQATLAAAANADPNTLKDPLQLASALAAALGGELTFESQPGQGSRIGFSALFQGFGPHPPAPLPASPAHQPRPVTAFQPRPTTTLVPRKTIGLR